MYIKVTQRKPSRPRVANVELGNFIRIQSNLSADEGKSLDKAKAEYNGNKNFEVFVVTLLIDTLEFEVMTVAQAEEFRDALDSMIKYVKGEEDK